MKEQKLKQCKWLIKEPADKKELETALKSYAADPASRNEVTFYEEVLETALWLKERNQKHFTLKGDYWFLPQALVPYAYECQWTLQHNCDSYGCDYDWCYSPDGMEYILYESRQCQKDWAEDQISFEDRFGEYLK